MKANSTIGQSFQTYLVFPLSAVSSIGGASLRFFGRTSAVGALYFNVFGVADTTWMESGSTGIKWNTKPTAGSRVGTGSYSATTNGWQTLDVGSYVASRKMAGATNVGFVIIGSTSSTTSIVINSRSISENSGRPELILTP